MLGAGLQVPQAASTGSSRHRGLGSSRYKFFVIFRHFCHFSPFFSHSWGKPNQSPTCEISQSPQSRNIFFFWGRKIFWLSQMFFPLNFFLLYKKLQKFRGNYEKRKQNFCENVMTAPCLSLNDGHGTLEESQINLLLAKFHSVGNQEISIFYSHKIVWLSPLFFPLNFLLWYEQLQNFVGIAKHENKFWRKYHDHPLP